MSEELFGRFEWLELDLPDAAPETEGDVAAFMPAPMPVATPDGLALPPRVDIVPVAGLWPAESAALWHLRRQVERLRLASGFERLACLDACRIDHYPHQHDAALRALRDMRGRALFADEVGLGKTIEAGLVMKELVVRGLAHRVLVLAPASLTGQWREELEVKFGEPFSLAKKPEDWEGTRVIASLDLARQPKHAAIALAQAWDLVIVDEAHKLKRRTTLVHQLVARLNKRYLLLLTATPVQNDMGELFNLVNLLAEGQLGTPRAFEHRFMDAGDPRMPINAPALRDLLSEVMIRNRRASVGIKLPPRRAGIYHLEMPEDERTLYDGLTDFIADELDQQPEQSHLRLTLRVLQRGMTSSPPVVAQTLATLMKSPELQPWSRARLAGYAAMANAIPVGRKVRGLGELLGRFPDEQVLIYTEFRRSQDAIAAHLRELGHDVVCFHGGLDMAERAAVVASFKSGTRVMVSTESGAEGLNLQFCHTLVNFDLPWNPMRIEQRIGRLHRLGQTHPVTVLNLAFDDTVEAHLVALLATKIRVFELVVGELDMILGEVDERRSFEDLIATAWQRGRGGAALAAEFAAIGDEFTKARGEYADVKCAGDALGDVLAGRFGPVATGKRAAAAKRRRA